jgi:hypothetical protein
VTGAVAELVPDGVADEVAGAAGEVTGAVAELVVAGAVAEVADVMADWGEVAACACRENTSKTVRIPAARIATCTARRAM